MCFGDAYKVLKKIQSSLQDAVCPSVYVFVLFACVRLCVWAGGLLLLLVGCGAVLSVLWDICGLRDGLCGTVLC